MRTRDELFRQAQRVVAARRQQAVTQAENARRAAYAAHTEISAADDAHMHAGLALARLAAAGGNLEEARARLEQADAAVTDTARAAGYARGDFEPSFTCPKCRDTGIYEGGVCSCLERLYNRELTKELGTLMQNGDESFEKFDLRLYPESFDPAVQAAPREVMTLVFERCRRYAESFPNVSSNLLFQGGTGLGKTYLSACIARVVAEKGFSVCYDSASAALESYERAKFGRDTEDGEAAALRVRRMESCDLMILDDLGTEMITPMSLSALYTLINTRLVNGRKMIISTNCSEEELAKKYTPQICSRIAGEFIALPFVGQDIRKLKRGI